MNIFPQWYNRWCDRLSRAQFWTVVGLLLLVFVEWLIFDLFINL